MYRTLFFASLVSIAQSTFAVEFFEGKLTTIEPTYLPYTIAFNMDDGNSTCPAGKQLKWSHSDVENNKAVYSTLLAAFMAGKRIRFYINDGDTNCVGTYLHLLND